mgnify:CR=1 FL=1|tara:strand:- start:3651 stop:3842 length:192 start_codon:yes stop_codon:yes gene_type:complete
MATKRETSTIGNLVIQKDPETGELYLELPKDTLRKLGWSEGDDLEWIENPDGTWQVIKKENEK